MGVEGSASPDSIIAAVEEAGYGASLKGASDTRNASANHVAEEDALKDKETPVLKKRLIASIGFLAVLMYFSMGHMMWGWPLPSWFEGNHVAMGLLQMILAAIVMVINQKFFISGFKSLWHRAPNMDTLVALGSMASFVWSVIALFLMTDAQLHGDMEGVMRYMDEFYFESAAMILTLIIDGKESVVPIEQVKKGDIFAVRPGESIPVDGIVTEGNSAVNEAALTGESIPVDKAPGDLVSAATINQSGYLRCEASRVGDDTTLSQIIKMVSDAAATKAPIAKVADKVSGVFVPVVISISLVTLLVWLLLGKDFAYALARGISVLVISCPCALGLATPVAIMVGNGLGAKNGILFKTAVSLEETGKVQIVALDKTGTITNGTPKVTDIVPAGGISQDELLRLAFALEAKSEHPLAKAIVEEGKSKGLDTASLQADNFTALVGNGLEGSVEGAQLLGGSVSFISGRVTISKADRQRAALLAESGKTPLLFARDKKFLGIIAVADTIKEDSPKAIRELQNMGIRVVMLTGDNERTARAIGAQAGVDEVIAGVLPEGKEQVIRALKEKGKTAMVGDGINDAPALTRADIGIAIGAGADVAIDAADVVLMKSNLTDVAAAVRLSRASLRNIHENLFWAFIYNIIGIPLAAGVYAHWGLLLNPMFGAAAMSLSSFCVVSNALRLNFCRLHDASHDRKRKKHIIEGCLIEKKETPDEFSGAIDGQGKEEKTMTKTMKIEGMMCGHCEKRVKKVLEAIDGVESAEVSYEAGTAVVTLSSDVADDVLKKAVEDQDYTVKGIE